MNNKQSNLAAAEQEMAEAHAYFETATFGMGCFWGPEARFGSLPGVLRTRVGYAGGHGLESGLPPNGRPY